MPNNIKWLLPSCKLPPSSISFAQLLPVTPWKLQNFEDAAKL